MPAHQVPVSGELDIGLYTVGTHGQRVGVCGTGMFSVLGACPTVRENFHSSEANRSRCLFINRSVNTSCPTVDDPGCPGGTQQVLMGKLAELKAGVRKLL